MYASKSASSKEASKGKSVDLNGSLASVLAIHAHTYVMDKVDANSHITHNCGGAMLSIYS